MVMWDESKDDVIGILEVNGYTGASAEAIYSKARSERIAFLRACSEISPTICWFFWPSPALLSSSNSPL